jgi:malonyl CoA-acyl carrier protein transacylase/thioesterase domain-containing protein/aryl carrier-like protein
MLPLSQHGPLHAAVTSLGMAGTNAVAILGSPALAEPLPGRGQAALLCLSARDREALARLSQETRRALDGSSLAAVDVGFTSCRGRRHFEHRLAVVGEDLAELARGLGTARGAYGPAAPQVAFLFTGQGSLYAGVGRELYHGEPAFRAALDRCAEVLGEELLPALWERPDGPRAQPALFALEWALAQLWQSWGVRPQAVIGHSLGEYVAACVAGVLSPEEGLRLVAARGRLMATLAEGGGMLSVEASLPEVSGWIAGHGLEVAAVNAPSSTVVSGWRSALEVFAAELEGRGVRSRWLPVATAFHCGLVDPILPAFRREVERVKLRPPQLRLVSTVTGEPVRGREICSVEHWVRGLREPVLFERALSWARVGEVSTFLELGPQPVLSALARQVLQDETSVQFATSLRRGVPERRQMLEALGVLYQQGVDPDWDAVHAGRKLRRVPLPTYPLQSSRAPTEAACECPGLEGVVAATLGVEARSLRPEDNLFERGLDSLRVMQLLAEVRRRFGVLWSPADVARRPTLEGLAELLARGGAGVHRPLVRLQQSGAGLPVICLHPAGGLITPYLRLAALLQGRRPVSAIESRGLRGEEHSTLLDMAQDYADLIRAEWPREPVALLGWSFGAVLAHEVAGQLEILDHPVAQVVLIDPLVKGPPAIKLQALLSLLHSFCQSPPTLAELRSKAGGVADQELHRLCLRQGWLAAGRPDEQDFARHLELYRRHASMLAALPAAPLAIAAPVLFFTARRHPGQGWTRGDFAAFKLGGDHYSIMRPPLLERIVEHL